MVGTRILIVEDEGLVAEEIKISLNTLGYEVAGIVYSGEAAVAFVEELRPDLILMDIKIKGEMDGIMAAEQIKRRFQIPVLFLTAYTDTETLQRAKITLPFGYLIKPLGKRELHVAVEMALYRHRMEQEREAYTRQLEAALAQVKTLSGLLPICASCKSIRNDQGYWQQVEEYIENHTAAHLDEAICPECLAKAHVDSEKFKKMARMKP